MNAKPVILREAALGDINEATDYFLRHSGESFTQWFIKSLESTFRHISECPKTASLEYTRDLDIPNLKIWPLVPLYPYVVFFLEREAYIDVWRVLYAEREILDLIQPRPVERLRPRRE